MTDPVTSATLSIVQVFWGLSKKLAQRKHFPSIDWTISFSKYVGVLTPFFEANFDPVYGSLVQTFKEVLQKEDDLQEIVQLVGRRTIVQWTSSRDNILDFGKKLVQRLHPKSYVSQARIPCPRTRNAHWKSRKSFARIFCSRTGFRNTTLCAPWPRPSV